MIKEPVARDGLLSGVLQEWSAQGYGFGCSTLRGFLLQFVPQCMQVKLALLVPQLSAGAASLSQKSLAPSAAVFGRHRCPRNHFAEEANELRYQSAEA